MKPLSQPRPASARWLRRGPWILAAVLPLAALTSPAYAFWQSQSSGSLSATADSIAAGNKPSAIASGADVSVSWPASSTRQGRSVTGYVVTRYSTATGGTSVPATGGCSGTVTALSCVEVALPVGSWYYAVTPMISSWSGAESSRSASVNTDTAPPVVNVASISPAPNAAAYNNSSPVTVNLAAQDGTGGSGVASISYSIDGGTPVVVHAANAAVVLTGEGIHTISYFATDNAGNAGTAQSVAVRIDTMAPSTPTVSAPAYVNGATRANVTVNGTAEPGSAISLRVTDAGSAHTISKTGTTDGSGVWSITGLDLSALNDGTVTFSAAATDQAGNTGGTGSASGIKDVLVAPPVINAPGPVNPSDAANFTVSGSAEAGASVRLTVSDGIPAHAVVIDLATNGSGMWSGSVNLSGLNPGSVNYSAVATDPAGNVSAPGTSAGTKVGPKVSAVTLGTGNGLIGAGDSVSIAFGQAMDASSFCSMWSSTGPQTINGNNDVAVTITNAPGGDTLTVTSGTCPGLKIGTVGLGGNYVSSATATFSANGTNNKSSVSWNPTTATLTITLGVRASGTVATTAASAGYPSYTPAAGLSDAAGDSLATTTFTSGTASRF